MRRFKKFKFKVGDLVEINLKQFNVPMTSMFFKNLQGKFARIIERAKDDVDREHGVINYYKLSLCHDPLSTPTLHENALIDRTDMDKNVEMIKEL